MFRRVLYTGVLLGLLVSSVPYASALTMRGETCRMTDTNYCIYEDTALKATIGSMTVIPRFYHMAQSCYMQAAMLATITYYNENIDAGTKFKPGDTGVPTWTLDSFCTKEIKDGDLTINGHVKRNVELLYKEGSLSSPLQEALKYSQTSMLTNPEAVLGNTSAGTPDKLVSDILWREFFAYSAYLKDVQQVRTPNDLTRGVTWSGDANRSSGGSAIIAGFLRGQVELLYRVDNTVDLQLATVTRYVADIMYTEFLRTYPEHLQYLVMQKHLRTIGENIDRMERAFTSLGIKLPDAYVIGK